MIGSFKEEKFICRNIYFTISEGYEGFLKDVSFTLIDKTDAFDPKKRENYWMKTLRNLAPDGVHVEDSVRTTMIFHALIRYTELDCRLRFFGAQYLTLNCIYFG